MLIIMAVVGGSLVLAKNLLPSLFKLILIAGIAALAIMVAILAIGLVFAFKSSNDDQKNRKTSGGTLSEDETAVLKNGREKLMDLRRITMGIKNSEIKKSANDICGIIDKIIQTLKQKPEKISNVRQFFNYYLPTLAEILVKYKRLEESGTCDEDMTNKVKVYMGEIKEAMDKQYTNLFADDMLDMSVDMEAMKMAVKRDGLISDEAVEIKDGNQTISLTL